MADKTDEEIVTDANDLAREFYRRRGYHVPKGYRFDKASHPQEQEAWDMAVFAYEFVTATDVEDALRNIEEDDPTAQVSLETDRPAQP